MTEKSLHLILSIPQGIITATSLGIPGFARHRSPGSGKYFHGRSIFFDLVIDDTTPSFQYLDEGGWRDGMRDTVDALQGCREGKRTKTALSSNGFSCTPVDALSDCYLIKTGGQILAMKDRERLAQFESHGCHEGMTPDAVAEAVGIVPPERRTHLYMIISPVEFIVLSSLTAVEYAWYATHRPGKIFRQVAFTELLVDQTHLAAESRYMDARNLLVQDPRKKTKTILTEDCINRVPFSSWAGYHDSRRGGIYVGDRTHVSLWRFPSERDPGWERAKG